MTVKSKPMSKGMSYYDPFYDTMKAFLRGEVTWEEMKRVDSESLEVLHQRRALRCVAENELSRGQISPEVLDSLLSKSLTTPNE